ncbi:aspartate carbamoyltransferase regulatory subunit [Williamwhitmania taraxaci]|uniref:Aspartate carbamoyltransferase regulatory chain n=1 Tax=Williamwhitmania taraxaci TaxID=1640674 RepID=A0A1G6GNA2_9BACT|nr:aspartate carbamoyltransferase regulatory subunit [Williamwhitmania taraxaci]SDB83438.1 aspartate carbamoyltransferase regulatory subunit [Williamwhitmania taraxaci]
MKIQKQLSVSAIENGTAIDHIPADSLFNVINILGLDHYTNQITFGTNLESKLLGRKAIIKIADKYFEDADINKISLVAPTAKLNIIKDYEVVEKKEVQLPETIEGIIRCVNPKCITNNDKVKPKYSVESKTKVSLRCLYCEKITDQEHFEFL